jgi:predicted metal-dependent hydrolase
MVRGSGGIATADIPKQIACDDLIVMVYYTLYGMRIDILKRLHRRSISLHILPTGELEVRAPKYMPEFVIRQFVAAKSEWIEKTRDRLATIPKTKQKTYREGEVFRLGGKEYALHITDGNAIVLTPSRLFFPKKFLGKPKEHMEKFCRVFAQQFLSKRLSAHAAKMKVSYKRITIRDTSTRWGSCSSSGTISFSYRLILAELPIIDYVLIHELAHITHPHHRLSFWARVGEFYPEYAMARTWLRKNGHSLVL